MKKITVVTSVLCPSQNAFRVLSKCMQSVRKAINKVGGEYIIVDDNSATDIAGQITASSINFDFDYTNNAQGGRTGSTNAPVTVVAQGLPLAEWVSVTSIITQATGISITVTANDERNYSNP